MKLRAILVLEMMVSSAVIGYNAILYHCGGNITMDASTVNISTITGAIVLLTAFFQWLFVLKKDSKNITDIKTETGAINGEIQNNRTNENNEHVNLSNEHTNLSNEHANLSEEHKREHKRLEDSIKERFQRVNNDLQTVVTFVHEENGIRKNASSEKQDALNSIDVLRKFIELSDTAKMREKEQGLLITQLMEKNATLMQENLELKEQLVQVNEQIQNMQEQLQDKDDYDLD